MYDNSSLIMYTVISFTRVILFFVPDTKNWLHSSVGFTNAVTAAHVPKDRNIIYISALDLLFSRESIT